MICLEYIVITNVENVAVHLLTYLERKETKSTESKTTLIAVVHFLGICEPHPLLFDCFCQYSTVDNVPEIVLEWESDHVLLIA